MFKNNFEIYKLFWINQYKPEGADQWRYVNKFSSLFIFIFSMIENEIIITETFNKEIDVKSGGVRYFIKY